MTMIMCTQKFLEGQGYGVFEDILYEYNNSAILLGKHGRKSVRKRSRHLNFRYFYVTDIVDRDKLIIPHFPALDMPADYMTKQLQGTKFLQFKKTY